MTVYTVWGTMYTYGIHIHARVSMMNTKGFLYCFTIFWECVSTVKIYNISTNIRSSTAQKFRITFFFASKRIICYDWLDCFIGGEWISDYFMREVQFFKRQSYFTTSCMIQGTFVKISIFQERPYKTGVLNFQSRNWKWAR